MDSKKPFRIHQGSSEKNVFFAGRGVLSLDPPFNGRSLPDSSGNIVVLIDILQFGFKLKKF
jgi:hypothetical protein